MIHNAKSALSPTIPYSLQNTLHSLFHLANEVSYKARYGEAPL
jgi:hypothetical protein